MNRSIMMLSFLALAAAAFTASGVEVVDLTLAARRAGASSYSVTTTSQGSSWQAKTAFDGVYDGNSAQAWHSVDTNNVSLTYQFNDSFNQGKLIHLTSYNLYFNSSYSGAGTAQYPCKMPSGWTFEGSNDGDSWTVLDTQSGLTSSSYIGGRYKPFPLRTSASYRRYRFNFTGVCNSNANHQYYIIAEIRFDGCIIDSEDDMATLRLWKGGATGNWEDATNWTAGRSGETPPLAGDDVVLGDTGAVSVNLSSSTPHLSSLALGGYGVTATLSTTNWTTCIEADAIRINGNGVVTCSPASMNLADIGRVWFKCGDMNIASGATIDADKKGYAARPVSNNAVRSGVGPGGGNGMCGGSHGGYGANSFYDTVARPSSPYGSAEWPETPGSSGSTMYARGASGGGVVKIEATGHVVVNGTITANGGNVSQYGISSSSSNRDGAGSGGSICITAETIAGTNGVICAKGGGGMALAASVGGKVTGASRAACAGGGGRIALHYDTSLQRANWLNGVTVSTTAGNYSGGSTPYTPTLVKRDDSWIDADVGTVWFSDSSLFSALVGKLSGQICGFDTLSLGSLNFTAGHVRFPAGFSLNVAGDLTVNSTSARLEFGGDYVTNLWRHASLCSTQSVHLAVGGNLNLTSGGRLDIRSAATNGVDAFGASVEVGGNFSIASNSACYAWCDAFNGGAPHFEVGNLHVAEGGLLSASERGFPAGWVVSQAVIRSQGYGPGGGKSTNPGTSALGGGGGHGGRGGKQGTSVSGATYDDPYSPSLAGSGGAVNWKYCTQGGVGGGVVHVCATNSIVVDGTVSADGQKASGDYAGGGAGGSVYLAAPSVYGASTGVISAKGGNPSASTSAYMAGGGGGRIAIWTGEKYVKGGGLARKKSQTPVAGEDGNVFLGTCSVDGGVSGYDSEGNIYSGAEGTIWYVNVIRSGLQLIFH